MKFATIVVLTGIEAQRKTAPTLGQWSVFLALLLSLCACSNDRSDSALSNGTCYHNGTVWTGLTDGPSATALRIGGERIKSIGDAAIACQGAMHRVDLKGGFLMPGFIDNHVHFIEGGAALASVDLRDAQTPEEFTQRIASFAQGLPSGRWVLNGNWDHQNWGGELPHRDWIDAATVEIPVFVIRLDGHMALANSAALRLAGIDAATPVPAAGEIIKDAEGRLTGVLKDTAMNAVFDVIPAASDQQLLAAFDQAQQHALSHGITQVHSMSANENDLRPTRAYRLAAEAGTMQIRVNVFTPLEQWEKFMAHSPVNNPLLRMDGVKGFVDGSLGSATAWFYQDYTDQPGNDGFPLLQMDRLGSLVEQADRAGLKIAVHGIGDRAIDRLLDILQAVGGEQTAQKRFRIEHFQHPSRAAIERLAAEQIIASMQPYHAIDDGRWAEQRIGSERASRTYAFRSILDAGGILTFGSDWPVAPLAPLQGVYAAVTRRTTDGAHPEGWQAQEKISVEEALRAYTVNNAYAVFEETQGGTLEVGKRADLVILSADPRKVDPESIPQIKVMATIVAGQTVFEGL